jgi:hypothetical protein
MQDPPQQKEEGYIGRKQSIGPTPSSLTYHYVVCGVAVGMTLLVAKDLSKKKHKDENGNSKKKSDPKAKLHESVMECLQSDSPDHCRRFSGRARRYMIAYQYFARRMDNDSAAHTETTYS